MFQDSGRGVGVGMNECVIESPSKVLLDLVEKTHVLHVDDDPGFLKVTKQCLEMGGPFRIDGCLSVDEALEKLGKGRYDVVISDYQMPGKDSLEFLRLLREKGSRVPFIMLTGKGREEVAIRALNLGADHYVNKTGETGMVYTELAHSITELAKARKVGEKESEEWSRTFDAITDLVFIVDNDYRIVRANRKTCDILNKRPEELVGKHCYETIHSTPKPWPTCPHGKALVTKKPESAEIDEPHLGITLLVSISPIYDAKGEFTHCVHVAKDISERKKAMQELLRFSAAVKTSLDGVITGDMKGKIVDVNEAAFRMYGSADKNDLIGKSVFDLLVERDRPRALQDLKESIRTGQGNTAEYTALAKNGAEIPVEITTAFLREEQGQPVGFVGIVRNLAERRKVEQMLVESQQKFAALFSGNPEATVYIGTDMHILDINPRFTGLFGYSLDEVKGRTLTDVVVPENLVEEGKMLDRKAAEGYVYRDTVRKRKDGVLIPVSISAAPIFIRDLLVGYIGVYKDISQQKAAETKLALTNEKLRVVGSLTRHDVKNKLSIITGNAYLVKKKLKDHPEMTEDLEELESACKMIVQLLDFARDYERLGVEELTYVNVEDSVQKAASHFPNIDGTKIVNECHGLTVLADSLLRQLFYNLVDNSLKHGGHVKRIMVSYEESEDQLRLVYEDDGDGIPEGTKPKLFAEGFTTGEGSGYGLYLTKKMVEVYGWTIQETGTPGRGARFIMAIPRSDSQGKRRYLIR
jgi:PAS domain S-box-containing protein